MQYLSIVCVYGAEKGKLKAWGRAGHRDHLINGTMGGSRLQTKFCVYHAVRVIGAFEQGMITSLWCLGEFNLQIWLGVGVERERKNVVYLAFLAAFQF